MKLLLSCLLLLPLSAHAASFDCGKAATPIEKAICADSHLSALDDQMGKAYQGALAKSGEAAIVVRHEQRAWLSALKDQCDSAALSLCLAQQETARISALNATQPFNPSQVTEYRLTNASHYFNFTLRLFAKPPDPGDTTREGPGHVLIYTKGRNTPLQTIAMDNMFVSLGKDGQPLANTSPLYDYQGVLNLGDFNFDGHEDFAIQNGNTGAYDGPSYDVYLYAPATGLFQFSSPLTDLIAGSLGFFEVDGARKLLVTLSKDGCCHHTTTSYQVVEGKPDPVARVIEDATRSDKYVLVSDQRKVNGKWQGTTKRIPQAQ